MNTSKFVPQYKWKIKHDKPGMKLSTIALSTLAAVLLLSAGILIGRLTSTTTIQQTRQAGGNIVPSAVAIPTADLSAPELDVPGEHIPGLPPYPGMRRVEYRQVILGDLLETEVEYVMEGDLDPVHDYYRQVFDEEGWSVADLHIFQGEWTFFVIKDDREALVELESRGPLVEVEVELTEPIPAQMVDVTSQP